MEIVLLVVALAVILLGAELFTNGIEWFGHKLNLAEGAVGSVLAGIATAMPETLIPVIAIVGPTLSGSPAGTSAEIGVGAILGAPFMLSTLAMFVTGGAVVIFARRGRRSTVMSVNRRVVTRDLLFFAGAYGLAIGAAFVPSELAPIRWAVAAVLVVAYAAYVRAHFADEAGAGDSADLNRLHATRIPIGRLGRSLELDLLPVGHQPLMAVETPHLRIIVLQVMVAFALILIGAQIFVGAVEHIAASIQIDPRILALIIAPIATELPEQSNSVLWTRASKDTLAIGNVTGAMVFQSCLPTVLGILLTDWRFGPDTALAFGSAAFAFVSLGLIFAVARRAGRLTGWMMLIGGPIYLVYVALALLLPAGGAVLH